MVQKEEKNEKPSHSEKMGMISKMKRERRQLFLPTGPVPMIKPHFLGGEKEKEQNTLNVFKGEFIILGMKFLQIMRR